MRIISGKFKRKKLLLPNPKITRPLRDYVKESLFNLLSHSKLINFIFEKSVVLDIFSGSGSFGIECISRGSKKVFFFEKSDLTINILNKNINNLSINNNCKIIFGDFLKANLNKILKKNIDLIFLDPPFNYPLLNELFIKLKNFQNYFRKTLIIIHHENKNKFDFEKYIKILIKKKYGRSMIIIGLASS